MKTTLPLLSLVAFTAALALGAHAAPKVGQAAPDFSVTDIHGRALALSDYKGKTVVLEWVNPECPFVQKHYNRSDNIPALQKAATADGIIWLQINSGHPGAEGDYDPAQAETWMKARHVASTAYCRDLDGKVGKLYDARTTPHLFIIDAAGILVYAGGIDSIRSANPADITKATNYVKAALDDLKAGRPVAKATSQPYGCSVKYGQ